MVNDGYPKQRENPAPNHRGSTLPLKHQPYSPTALQIKVG